MDVKAIIESSVLVFLYWGLAVGAATAFGYPGIVCITPVAWLLALNAGQLCIRRSRSGPSEVRIREAAFTGFLIGFAEGITYSLIIATAFEPSTPHDLLFNAISSIVITLGGTIVCAVISAAFAHYIENKQARIPEQDPEVGNQSGDNLD